LNKERLAAGVTWLPPAFDKAVAALAEDPLNREVLDDEMFDVWVEFKRAKGT